MAYKRVVVSTKINSFETRFDNLELRIFGEEMNMMNNKTIHRENSTSSQIFDDRTLAHDYRTLVPVLRSGMHVLDVGCGTASITKDIARVVSPGLVVGIDNTSGFIEAGQAQHGHFSNLQLRHVDLFQYKPERPFDLIVSARTLQWLSHVPEAVTHMVSLLRIGGTLSVLDYNHTEVEWNPEPPASMKKFYGAFLRWREESGMNNRVGDELAPIFRDAGLKSIEVFPADEHHVRGDANFRFRLAIWNKVAGLRQIADEGYIAENDRLLAVEEYSRWIENEAQSMTLKLRETRGKKEI